LFLEALEKVHHEGKLRFSGDLADLAETDRFLQYLAPLRKAEWVVYAKPPFGGPLQAIGYLGRYTHRVAISDQRILKVRDGRVTFQWKDYRRKEKQNSLEMTLEADEFLRRFLIHVLPPGFPRIRYYGFLANRNRREQLALCRKLLTEPATELLPEPRRCRDLAKVLDQKPEPPCPQCRQGTMRRVGFVAGYLWPLTPPDTS
jgi:hypothetical protein